MQTKKRAKSVSFGKKVKETAPIAVEKETVEIPTLVPTPEELQTKQEVAPPPIDLGQETSTPLQEPPIEAIPEKPSVPTEQTLEPQPQPETSAPTPPKSGSSFGKDSYEKEGKSHFFRYFLLLTCVAFLVGLSILAGIFYGLPKYKTMLTNLPILQKPTVTPKPSPTTTVTPTPAKVTSYKIKLLNGSGITGQAAKVKSQLVTAGFTVAVVGNADNSTFTKTIISAQKEVDENYTKKLIETLKKSYDVDTAVKSIPSGVGDANIIVTIGSSLAK